MEILAVILTLLSAYYTVIGKVICWPLAIVSTVLYIYLLAVEKLYFQVIADTIILYQCVVGWYYWKGTEDEVGVFLAKKILIRDIILVIIGTLALIYPITKYTNDPQPALDIVTTLLALLANWYLAKKFIDGFLMWVVTDIFLIAMFFIQGMYWSGGLYIILIGFALQGHFKWKSNLEKQLANG